MTRIYSINSVCLPFTERTPVYYLRLHISPLNVSPEQWTSEYETGKVVSRRVYQPNLVGTPVVSPHESSHHLNTVPRKFGDMWTVTESVGLKDDENVYFS